MAKNSLRQQYEGMNRTCCFKISLQEIIYIICVTILCCGVEFVYDVPGSLQVFFMDPKSFGLTYSQYSLFYSVYALPNIFLCFFGGFLIDSALGIRSSTIIYMMIAFLGSSLFALGGFLETFWLMLLGRIFFGLGTEMGSSVCLNYMTFTKFKDTNMNLVFSISDNFGYMGTIAAYQLCYRLYNCFRESMTEINALKVVLIITSSLLIVSSASGILMTYLTGDTAAPAIPEEDPLQIKGKQEVEKEEKSLKMKDMVRMLKTPLTFPPIFWLLCLTSACFINAIYTFEAFSQDMFSKLYNLNIEDAGYLIMVLNVTKIVFSIPVSMMVDRVGRNTLFVLLAVWTAVMAHVCISLNVNPQICMILLGLSYTTMGSSIVPMYAYPLDKRHYGLCYGIVTSFSNLSLFICPMIAGQLIDNYGYLAAEVFYLSGLAVGLCCISLVWVLDKKTDGILTLTPKERLAHEQRPLASKERQQVEV